MKRGTRTICRFGLIVVVLAGFGAPVGADDCLEPAGRWPDPFGPATAVAVSDNIAYYGLDRMLVVADVSDPTSPIELGVVEIPERAQDIAVLEEVVYVATYSNGIRIIDASDPSTPVEVGEYIPPHGRVYGIDVEGRYVYLAADLDGLIVLDARVPSAPFKMGSIGIHSSVVGYDVAVSRGIAYVAGGAWLQVVGVAYPASPQRITGVRSYANHLAIGDGTLYGLGRGGSYEAMLQVFDIHDPARIREITSYSVRPAGYGVAYSDGHVYVASEQTVTVLPADSPYAWASITPGLYATTGNAMGVVVSEDRAYVAAGSAGLQVVDVSAPMEPLGLGGAPTSGASTAVVVSEARAYSADCTYRGRHTQPQPPCTFRAIDVKLGTEPTELGSLELSEIPVEIAVSEDLAVVLSDDSYRVIDVSDPGGPVEVAAERWGGQTANGLAMARNHAFIVMAGYTNGLLVADLSSPTSPAWVGIVHGAFSDVAVENDIAFVVDLQQAGFRVLDVSDPAAPVEIGFGETPEPAGQVVVTDGFAYVTELVPSGWTNSDPDLWIFDLADPTAPILVGTYQATGSWGESFLDLDVAGGLAYLAVFWQESSVASVLYPHWGMRVVDVSDPTSPVGLEYLESVGIAGRVAAYPGRAILADGWAGLELFDPSNCPGYVPPPSLVRSSTGRVVP